MISMDSRNLLVKTQRVQVLLDTNSYNSFIAQGNRNAIAIMGYFDSEFIQFVRTPIFTSSEHLQTIPEYAFELDADGWIRGISVSRINQSQKMSFGYKKETLFQIAQIVYEKHEITDEEFEKILLVFIQAIFSETRTFHEEIISIFITNEPVLLKKRLWFESHFPGRALNIMSLDEATIFLDLFHKKTGKYLMSTHWSLNKGYWYLLSMRQKIPHYNVGDPMIDALSKRFEFCLMALDEMGIQFFSGANNDTMDNTLYHFNYLISLITGIFDNLALKTNTQLGINYTDLRKVCINNNGGKEFLREVRSRNQELRDHISSYMNFINLIYEFRELVVHREGLAHTGFEDYGDLRWKANFITVNANIGDRIRTCGDMPSEFDPYTVWGYYNLHDFLLLEPYHFALEVVMKLTSFVDKYLELLGYPLFIESARTRGDEFANTLNQFERGHLGF
jgi:hypothetical protein